jgi:hypothetical protein
VSITAHGTRSFALSRDAASPGDVQLIDFNHWGVGLEWSF